MACNKYSRILLKLSGESFKGERGYGIDPVSIEYLATQINNIHELGVEIAEENSKFFENHDLSNEKFFSKEASSSMERQKQLESEKGLPFETYLREFLNKVS